MCRVLECVCRPGLVHPPRSPTCPQIRRRRMDDGRLARRPSPPLTSPTNPVADASPATAPPVPGAAQGEDDGGLAADYPGSVAELKSSALVGELQRAGRRAGRAGRHIGLAGVWACSGVSYSAWRLRKSAVLAESPSHTAPRMTALGATSARGRRRSRRREVEWRQQRSIASGTDSAGLGASSRRRLCEYTLRSIRTEFDTAQDPKPKRLGSACFGEPERTSESPGVPDNANSVTHAGGRARVVSSVAQGPAWPEAPGLGPA
ncbi:hypothetical protein B0H10DRAFT_2333896 [Mycena sp. CBHHK59/15]|nr:hypothetical protein B0H10DRAFT_2333896 [Mycena sp. CBHHK59/15]